MNLVIVPGLVDKSGSCYLRYSTIYFGNKTKINHVFGAGPALEGRCAFARKKNHLYSVLRFILRHFLYFNTIGILTQGESLNVEETKKENWIHRSAKYQKSSIRFTCELGAFVKIYPLKNILLT